MQHGCVCAKDTRKRYAARCALNTATNATDGVHYTHKKMCTCATREHKAGHCRLGPQAKNFVVSLIDSVFSVLWTSRAEFLQLHSRREAGACADEKRVLVPYQSIARKPHEQCAYSMIGQTYTCFMWHSTAAYMGLRHKSVSSHWQTRYFQYCEHQGPNFSSCTTDLAGACVPNQSVGRKPHEQCAYSMIGQKYTCCMWQSTAQQHTWASGTKVCRLIDRLGIFSTVSIKGRVHQFIASDLAIHCSLNP